MMLCETDVRRLERAGYRRDDFSRRGDDGVVKLRNEGEHCCFYDAGARRCKEYARRPLGCVIYPVNMSPEGKVILDDLCPEADTVSEDEREEKGRRLRMLLDTIASEARRSRGST
jgi:Fe-S-cluster containining protein